MIARYRLPKLLQRPIGCGLGGYIAIEDTAGADLHYHEYIKDMEASGDRDQEVRTRLNPVQPLAARLTRTFRL